jgi:aldehyde dehydrogenase
VRAIAAALPPGVINVVTGAGANVGSALVSHPLVRAVAFTGGTETGRSVLSAGSSTLTIPTLELGGNDAAILLDDVAVTESLAAKLMAGALVTSGQVCFAVKRIYAPANLVADLVEACGQVMSAAVVGDGLESGNTMGPLANKSQFARARAFLDEARTKGAQILTHGQHGAGYSDEGYFMQPSLLTGIDETFGVVRDEQFAPLVPIMGYHEEAEAIRRANDTEFGLSSSVWSPDLERARSVARQMEAGTTYVNQHDMMAVNMSAPMGGVKHSGLGREQGAYAFEGFTELHQINDRRVPAPQA